jgi:hypothetical protein
MDRILKVIDWIVWILIMGSIIGFFVGTYEVIDLLILRSHHG